MKASCICLGKSLFSTTSSVDLLFLKVLKYFFLIFMGVLEYFKFLLDKEFHSSGLKVAYGEEEKIFISNNTSVLIIVHKYYLANIF